MKCLAQGTAWVVSDLGTNLKDRFSCNLAHMILCVSQQQTASVCNKAICDLVHDVETIFHLYYVLTASGNLFRNMSDACETASLIFQKRFPDAVNT